MRPSHPTLLALALALAASVGCGGNGPRTHPVSGRVEAPGGDVGSLAGSHVEAALKDQPAVRASGVINPDGTFTLQTQHDGAIHSGAREGEYLVRIVLNDDDPASRRRAARSVAPRYLRFESSGLAVRVPAEGDVTLKVARR